MTITTRVEEEAVTGGRGEEEVGRRRGGEEVLLSLFLSRAQMKTDRRIYNFCEIITGKKNLVSLSFDRIIEDWDTKKMK